MGDNDRDVADGEKSAPRDGPRSKRRMRDKIVISTVVAFCISSWLSPPDAATALVLGSGSAFLCGAALLILARSNFMKSLSPSMQAVVCILVCILSVLAVHASALYRTAGRINRPSDFASVSSSGSLSFGDLWIAHLSDRRGFWSRETECVICSADPPKTWGVRPRSLQTYILRRRFRRGQAQEQRDRLDRQTAQSYIFGPGSWQRGCVASAQSRPRRKVEDIVAGRSLGPCQETQSRAGHFNGPAKSSELVNFLLAIESCATSSICQRTTTLI